MIKKRELFVALLCLAPQWVLSHSLSGNLYTHHSSHSNFGTIQNSSLHVGPVGVGFGIGQYNGSWRGWKHFFKTVLGLNSAWKRKNITEWSEKDCIDCLEFQAGYNFTALSEREQISLVTQHLDMYAAPSFHDIICNLPLYKTIKPKLISYLYRMLADDVAVVCDFFDPYFYPKELPYLTSYAIDGIKEFLSKEGIQYSYAQNTPPQAISMVLSTTCSSLIQSNQIVQTNSLNRTPVELKNQINTLYTQAKCGTTEVCFFVNNDGIITTFFPVG